MIQRCGNPNNSRYKDYGGRGIQVCEAWHDFKNFFADMGLRPDGLSIDRKDNDGNYEPDNCRWSTPREQRNNSRPMSCGRAKQRWFQTTSPGGKIFCSNNQHEFAREYGLNRQSISDCLTGRRKHHKGWKFQKII